MVCSTAHSGEADHSLLSLCDTHILLRASCVSSHSNPVCSLIPITVFNIRTVSPLWYIQCFRMDANLSSLESFGTYSDSELKSEPIFLTQAIPGIRSRGLHFILVIAE